MAKIPLTQIEFYERRGGLIDALRSAAVPRQGEYVNIAKQQFRVAYVAWAIDTDRPWGKDLRANVELERVADGEVGPIATEIKRAKRGS